MLLDESGDLASRFAAIKSTGFRGTINDLKTIDSTNIQDNAIFMSLEDCLVSLLDQVITNGVIELHNDQDVLLRQIKTVCDHKALIKILMEDVNDAELILLRHQNAPNEQRLSADEHNYLDQKKIVQHCIELIRTFFKWLKNVKHLLDICLQFYEMSEDQMCTLDDLIELNIQTCIALQMDTLSSPVRHNPNFTLSQIVKLLSSRSEPFEQKIPAFSSADRALCERYFEIRKGLDPIEKSLTVVLNMKIDQFRDSSHKDTSQLLEMLLKKYSKLMNKYSLLLDKIETLKIALIDKKWNSLFINLNYELKFTLNEIIQLQREIFHAEYSLLTKTKLQEQLKSKSDIVIKTFDVIYKALEFSLLDPAIAQETNDLAQKWLDIRNLNDTVLINSIEQDSIEQDSKVRALDASFQNLSVKGSESNPKIEPASKRESTIAVMTPKKKVGAALLQKMNIQRVIATNTPSTSTKKLNPFLLSPAFRDNQDQRISSPTLNSIPKLPFVDLDHNKRVSSIAEVKSKTRQELEGKKIQFFSQQTSLLPTFNYESKKSRRTLKEKLYKSEWAPYSNTGSSSLRPPTPLTNLLAPLNKSIY